ncbi:dimethylsulfoniopropionate lyase DddW [Litoreibacter ponti]|uniref:Dimethylsulfoniopropionate lyase DddW n=1 Tax=Litoreibacter ponti TaxID=1510457 RepID=A0A2T6BMA0_9RHOB|nr:cupin domain-containing protein [Litoreibacter ponti]PTX57181.1 dimethylsulfoniopropionate lyase DddW [Litoreibacter ponti]
MKPLPVHVPVDGPAPEHWNDATKGSVMFRTLVDGSHGPTAGLVQGIATIAPGQTEAPHHHDIAETAYVLGGTGSVTLGDRTLEIRPGDSVYIPPQCRHAWTASDSDQLRFLYTFPADRFDDVSYHFERAA